MMSQETNYNKEKDIQSDLDEFTLEFKAIVTVDKNPVTGILVRGAIKLIGMLSILYMIRILANIAIGNTKSEATSFILMISYIVILITVLVLMMIKKIHTDRITIDNNFNILINRWNHKKLNFNLIEYHRMHRVSIIDYTWSKDIGIDINDVHGNRVCIRADKKVKKTLLPLFKNHSFNINERDDSPKSF